MNFKQPLKLHYFAYRRSYPLFWFLTIIAGISALYWFPDFQDLCLYVSVITMVLSFIFTIMIGIYEYNSLFFHYYYLKTNGREFYYSCLIYSVINSIIQTLGLTLIFGAIAYFYPENRLFPYWAPTTFIFVFLTHILLFACSCSLTILLRKAKHIRAFIYLSLLILFAIIPFEHYLTIMIFISNFYFRFAFIYSLIPITLVLIAFVFFIVFIEFRYLKNEKALSKR
ncbi:MAG: hypothetical protein GX661_07105 [Acholeplasmataceae bacterium]|nr:hypothetical protein [Acholeplasmataceae bacterium]